MTIENITVPVGKQFPVCLKSNPTTGYTWEIKSLPGNIEFQGSDFKISDSNIQPGDPGLQVFLFEAKNEGDYTISFILKRAWESTAVGDYSVKVKVR
jgi:predicted secreted protein